MPLAPGFETRDATLVAHTHTHTKPTLNLYTSGFIIAYGLCEHACVRSSRANVSAAADAIASCVRVCARMAADAS